MKYVLFGAGEIGLSAKTFLSNKMEVIRFVDNDPKKNGLRCHGIPITIYSPDVLKDKWIIITTGKDASIEISNQLERDEIYTYLFWDEIVKMYATSDVNILKCIQQETRRNIDAVHEQLNNIFHNCFMLHTVVVSLGQKCNFRCTNCGNMTPDAPEDIWAYPATDIIRWFDELLSNISLIWYVQIQGGEPFLYSDLEKIINYVGNRDEIANVTFATNGSIIPPETILKLIKKYNMSIRISDYETSRANAKKLYDVCNTLGIVVLDYHFGDDDSMWFDVGTKNTPREDNNMIVRNRFAQCGFKDCLTLERGELSHCSRGPNAHLIQRFTRLETDYVRADADIEAIKNYIRKAHFMTACRYCNGTDRVVKVAAGDQRKRNAGSKGYEKHVDS